MPPFVVGDWVEMIETVAAVHPVTGDALVVVEAGWRGRVVGYAVDDDEDLLMITVEFFFGIFDCFPESLRGVEPRGLN